MFTSNRAPHELYAGGLNRHVHIPAFCAALQAHGVRARVRVRVRVRARV